jgi:2-amino-4-hydroxy-6-hydroxymethyldihydropteridine diphosphokinase
MGVLAFIGLGSNLGDSRATLAGALRSLEAAAGVELLRSSSVLRTTAVGGPLGQPDYHNAVAMIETELGAYELLDLLQGIEAHCGRRRSAEQRWGPRTLDLDLLVFGELELSGGRLELPHPRLEERRFVLASLVEIAPGLRLPRSGRSARAALAALDAAAAAVPAEGTG